MSLFSKALPERKWPAASGEIGARLRRFQHSDQQSWILWTKIIAAARGVTIGSNKLEPAARRYLSLIQIGGVAAIIREQEYIKRPADVAFFLEAVYIILTGDRPGKLHDDIASLPFALTGDIESSLLSWAQLMTIEIAEKSNDPDTIGALKQVGLFTVIHAMIVTAEACGDRRTAKQLRREIELRTGIPLPPVS